MSLFANLDYLSFTLFLTVCTENSQCNNDAEKNVCDTTKNECVGKLNQLLRISNFHNHTMTQHNTMGVIGEICPFNIFVAAVRLEPTPL